MPHATAMNAPSSPIAVGASLDRASADEHRAVRWWLWIVLAMIFAMVIIGGTTRLTGSGLSMVEWQPLIGAVPPLSDADWERVFAQYRESPQFRQVNHWMGIEEFKKIFFWEYLHRLVGRLIGVVFAIPFAYFLVRRRMTKRLALLSSVAFVLGGAQGALGWYMVASGLVDVPAVSHYRLAAHLVLAFATGTYVLWLGLSLRPRAVNGAKRSDGRPTPAPFAGVGMPSRSAATHVIAATASRSLRAAISVAMVLLVVQIVYGAFMAGTHAGLFSSTFPDMNGRYSPAHFFTSVHDLLDGPAAIHWTHRTLAWALVLAMIVLSLLARRESARPVRIAALAVLAMALIQLTLGAITVILHVPIVWAVTHQAGAFVLLLALAWLAYEAGLFPRSRF